MQNEDFDGYKVACVLIPLIESSKCNRVCVRVMFGEGVEAAYMRVDKKTIVDTLECEAGNLPVRCSIWFNDDNDYTVYVGSIN
jgi:hypothetical protein